ncbi:MAG TPA: zf-TFIIB domain-containing protein [Allosphingosinicella sp.]|nr:zf-TFIIB domain-containing protein [Allosphingosinicella sp.]
MNEAAAMPCPVCKVPLVMSERQGVEIDYCPQCRGVWLDRGEIDKIIERSAADSMPPPAQQPQYSDRERGGYDRGHGHAQGDHRQGKRRKSFLEELFD